MRLGFLIVLAHAAPLVRQSHLVAALQGHLVYPVEANFLTTDLDHVRRHAVLGLIAPQVRGLGPAALGGLYPEAVIRPIPGLQEVLRVGLATLAGAGEFLGQGARRPQRGSAGNNQRIQEYTRRNLPLLKVW